MDDRKYLIDGKFQTVSECMHELGTFRCIANILLAQVIGTQICNTVISDVKCMHTNDGMYMITIEYIHKDRIQYMSCYIDGDNYILHSDNNRTYINKLKEKIQKGGK